MNVENMSQDENKQTVYYSCVHQNVEWVKVEKII